MCLFSSCNSSIEYNKEEKNDLCIIEGYAINNSTIEQCDAGYHIEELQNFFGVSSLQTFRTLYLADIDAQFPIKYLRKAEKYECCYIAYPVLEGGKFLVFLNTQMDFKTGCGKLIYSESLYIHNLPSRDDVTNWKDINTYDDLKVLAPCTVLNTIKSSSIDSYSILRDGSVLQCMYSKDENGNLSIESKEIISYNDPRFPFRGVVYSDLT